MLLEKASSAVNLTSGTKRPQVSFQDVMFLLYFQTPAALSC